MALGAERSDVLRIVIAQSLTLAGVGILAGLAGAWALGRFAGHLLHQVSPRDPLSFAAAAGIMLVVACLAGFVPARRASRIDPVVALRCE
jgi:ABC-type antimicrobial peptide transport system permease subunit